jgi:two-component system chemotaxis response regulator CheY
MMRTMITQNLEKLGFKNIDTATNGREALEKIKAQGETDMLYHIVMLDWHMPEVEGIEVLQTCRQNKRYDKMAIIMLTAEQEERNVLRAIEAGATSYLVKPVALDAMEKNINKTVKWLEEKGLDFDIQFQKKNDMSGKPDIVFSDTIKEELQPVIAKGLENIFSELFHVEILPDELQKPQGKKDMVCVGRLKQNDMSIVLRFFFNQSLLKPLLRQLYSTEFLENDEIFGDSACEIVNILCAQVKAFLNKKGYSLELGIPKAAQNDAVEDNEESSLNISFSLNESDNFMVDLNTQAI